MNTLSAKTFSWRKAIVVSLCVGLLAAGLSVFVQSRGLTVQAFSLEVPSRAPLGVGATYHKSNLPARLIIPAIGVDANIQSVGLSWHGNGDIGVPSNFTDVAWYNGGPLPGDPGSAIIDGHLDGKDVKEAVFYSLGNLRPGDEVKVVGAGGVTREFRVTDTKLYDYNATTTDIFSNNATKARLVLITCGGQWIKSEQVYSKRVVVFADLLPA